MALVWPFWAVLAGVFLVLAVLSWQVRRDMAPKYVKWAVWEQTPLTVAGLGKAIDHILLVELVGFAAAAVAAALSAFA